ncbi:MAG TPA: hypothetical protein VNJ08_06290 [Bacteriovoracaceae bacterium]|nr:hypothetical protein [Bacteriovoracaceae bacterium]
MTAISTGVDFEDILPGLACLNGDTSIFTFQDTNSNGHLDSDESVLKIKALCNGINGTNGVNGVDGINTSVALKSIASSITCPYGGVKFTSGNLTPVEVCNGSNGINGVNGLPGIQGIPGLAGSDGINGVDGDDGIDGINGVDGEESINGTNANITPVKFCPTDDSTFPEYGLLIGDDLFAVHWEKTKAFN